MEENYTTIEVSQLRHLERLKPNQPNYSNLEMGTTKSKKWAPFFVKILILFFVMLLNIIILGIFSIMVVFFQMIAIYVSFVLLVPLIMLAWGNYISKLIVNIILITSFSPLLIFISQLIITLPEMMFADSIAAASRSGKKFLFSEWMPFYIMTGIGVLLWAFFFYRVCCPKKHVY